MTRQVSVQGYTRRNTRESERPDTTEHNEDTRLVRTREAILSLGQFSSERGLEDVHAVFGKGLLARDVGQHIMPEHAVRVLFSAARDSISRAVPRVNGCVAVLPVLRRFPLQVSKLRASRSRRLR